MLARCTAFAVFFCAILFGQTIRFWQDVCVHSLGTSTCPKLHIRYGQVVRWNCCHHHNNNPIHRGLHHDGIAFDSPCGAETSIPWHDHDCVVCSILTQSFDTPEQIIEPERPGIVFPRITCRDGYQRRFLCDSSVRGPPCT